MNDAARNAPSSDIVRILIGSSTKWGNDFSSCLLLMNFNVVFIVCFVNSFKKLYMAKFYYFC